jgi:hypothetical protein
VFSPAWRMNGAVYVHPVLAAGTIFVTTSAIRSRFEQEPKAWPGVLAWYRYLDTFAVQKTTFAGPRVDDAILTIYRLPDSQEPERDGLPADWWLAGATEEARATLGTDAIRAPDTPPATGEARREARRRMFASRFEVFLDRLALLSASAGRSAAARRVGALVLREAPDDELAIRSCIASVVLAARRRGAAPPTTAALLDSLRALGADPTTAAREVARLPRL